MEGECEVEEVSEVTGLLGNGRGVVKGKHDERWVAGKLVWTSPPTISPLSKLGHYSLILYWLSFTHWLIRQDKMSLSGCVSQNYAHNTQSLRKGREDGRRRGGSFTPFHPPLIYLFIHLNSDEASSVVNAFNAMPTSCPAPLPSRHPSTGQI